jgi:hypothetical protein
MTDKNCWAADMIQNYITLLCLPDKSDYNTIATKSTKKGATRLQLAAASAAQRPEATHSRSTFLTEDANSSIVMHLFAMPAHASVTIFTCNIHMHFPARPQ